MADLESVAFVIMAGGRGERLWPLVSSSRPKVCLSVDGRRTLLQATIDRFRSVAPRARWMIVTTQGQEAAVRASVPLRLRRAVVAEPRMKNTAACIALAALTLRDRNGIMVVGPADHWISDTRAFRRAVRAAIDAARQSGTIVTIGIRPTHPHPGLGYLRTAAATPNSDAARRLVQFIEKPSPRLASSLFKRSGVYWNGGYFVARVDTFLKHLNRWLPRHLRELAPVASHARTRAARHQLEEAYRRLQPVSFDHGVMAHLRDGLVIEGRFGWADLGSWDAWVKASETSTDVIGVESRNVQVISQAGHLVATIGLRDLLVVHTPAATLICPKHRAQDVRAVVGHLRTKARLAAWL